MSGWGGDLLMELHGGIDPEERERVKAAFQAHPDVSPVRILLATDAASEGIDLQNHCNYLIHVEIPWNPNAASPPPPDSKSGTTWFARGVCGLQRWLDSLWHGPSRAYYLGEWHLHPGGAPTPSGTDLEQMTAIANNPRYACPEPILVILGGASPEWLMGAFVVTGESIVIPLNG